MKLRHRFNIFNMDDRRFGIVIIEIPGDYWYIDFYFNYKQLMIATKKAKG